MISDINFVTTRVEIYCGNVLQGSASGFFFRKEKEKYYVTNRHVVINEANNFFPDKIKLRLHLSRADLSKNIDMEILLYDIDGEKVWLEHPDYNSIKCDIVIIPLNFNTLKRGGMNIFNSASISFIGSELIGEFDVNPFGDLAVVGYPLGFYDQTNNLPVYRKAMMAINMELDSMGNHIFLLMQIYIREQAVVLL